MPQSTASVRPRRFIRELTASERIEGCFAIANAQLGKTKQDKPFLKCLIGDKTGQLPGRMWSIEPAQFRRLPTDGFVYIEAETQPSYSAHHPGDDPSSPPSISSVNSCPAPSTPDEMFAGSPPSRHLQHPPPALARPISTTSTSWTRPPLPRRKEHAPRHIGGRSNTPINVADDLLFRGQPRRGHPRFPPDSPNPRTRHDQPSPTPTAAARRPHVEGHHAPTTRPSG